MIDPGPVPPEVTLDAHGRQIAARRGDGRFFTRFVPCEAGCGFVIGVGDAVEAAAHESCLRQAEASTDPKTPGRPGR